MTREAASVASADCRSSRVRNLSDRVAGRGARQRPLVRQQRQDSWTKGQQRIASGETRAACFGIEIGEQPFHFPVQFGVGRGGRIVSAKGKRPQNGEDRKRQRANSSAKQ